jgi:hypothetical protein
MEREMERERERNGRRETETEILCLYPPIPCIYKYSKLGKMKIIAWWFYMYVFSWNIAQSHVQSSFFPLFGREDVMD